jgi:hypothetical protein
MGTNEAPSCARTQLGIYPGPEVRSSLDGPPVFIRVLADIIAQHLKENVAGARSSFKLQRPCKWVYAVQAARMQHVRSKGHSLHEVATHR